MIITGTCHFWNLQSAYRYYAKQDLDHADVDRKIDNGEIYIGMPRVPDGCTQQINQDGRYEIVEP